MIIIKFSELTENLKIVAIDCIENVSKNLGWNSVNLLNRTELLGGKYGGYIFFDHNEIFGYFILSDSDGNNNNSDNFAIYQVEKKAYWVCSMYLNSSKINLFFVIGYIKKELTNLPIYIYFENMRLFNIIRNRYNLISINELNDIFKII